MSSNYTILLVGMDSQSEALAREHFNLLGHTVFSASNLLQAEATIKEPQLDLVYLQQHPSSRAREQLEQIFGTRPGLPAVLICNDATAATALEAWHAGAADAIFLPLDTEALDRSLRRAALSLAPKLKGPDQARLRFLDDTGKERWAFIVPPRFTIGRSSSNDLVFPHMNI